MIRTFLTPIMLESTPKMVQPKTIKLRFLVSIDQE